MHIAKLNGKKVCILGFGREGRAMVEALERDAKGCEITIADQSDNLPTTHYPLITGPNYLKNLDTFDFIIKSPGIFPNPKLEKVRNKITNSTQIFLDTIKDSGAIVIGATGSKGKSTTSSLIYHILSQSPSLKAHSYLVGNIGEPAIAHLKDASSNTIFVHEMSSYQLMDLTSSPRIAVITSFFPEHLDYHGSLEKYLEAKKHIARFQKKEDCIFYNADNARCCEIAEESSGTKIPVKPTDAPVKLEDTKLKGKHNLENIALAWKVAEHLGIPKESAVKAIESFTPLPHRLESLGVHESMEWVNDSISTTPESAMAAIDALGDRVQTIILGGQDRGYDFSALSKRIANSSIETVILLPDSGSTIGEQLEKLSWNGTIVSVATMQEAVTAAKTRNSTFAQPSQKLRPAGKASVGRQGLGTRNSIVLLSPASPSYGHFKNFEERGAVFRDAIVSESHHHDAS